MSSNENYKLIIVGDLFPVPTNFIRYEKGDLQYLFGEKICKLFEEANYRVCNLEGALTDGDDKCEKTGPVVTAPTKTIKAIKSLGIDCCMLANNHITDAGCQGVIDTLHTLNHSQIRHIGAGENSLSIKKHLFIQLGNSKICFYNVAETMYNAPTKKTPGAHLYDEYIVCKELSSLKEQCDYLIVIYHGGAEKFRYPSPQTRKRFHRMVDSGANMILSQHTHCVGSEEYYKGAYLLYGQGNFLFRSFNNEFTDTGIIIEVFFEEGNPIVKKHLVNAIGDTVRYAEDQDFTSFDTRSSKIQDEEYVADLYEQYCRNELFGYLKSYKSRFIGRRIIRKFFPKSYKNYILNKAYDRRDLLFTLHSLRSEQNRETAINGIESLLNDKI